ncbi:hypothetical protein O0V09_18915, partial [Dasania sp. GY-19]
SIADFCREHNIAIKRFYYHRSQYIKRSKPSAFIRAKPQNAKPAIDTSAYFTLQCGSGQLSLPADVSPAWLASLMKALT